MNILTAKEVKDRLRCGLTTVYDLFRRGELKGFNLTDGKRRSGVRIFEESVAEFIERRSNKKPEARAQAEPVVIEKPPIISKGKAGRLPKKGSRFEDHFLLDPQF